jgi:hypothetical protein
VADLLVILTVVAFFGLCAALVRGCDHIIGPDDAEGIAGPEEIDVEPRDVQTVGVAR